MVSFGCASTNQPIPTSTTIVTNPSSTSIPSATNPPTETTTQTIPAPTLTATPEFQVCSPLGGFPLQEITKQITNKYSPPPQGSDDPHQGVDFSVLDANTGIALSGNTVKAALSGFVSSIILNRYPYGNGIIIETTRDSLPDSLYERLTIPTLALIETHHPSLTCPQEDMSTLVNEIYHSNQAAKSERSIYLLYAHLDTLEALKPGQFIRCGQLLGTVGSTGNALNPHLHLEARIGPKEARIDSMAHYDSSASLKEMASYCVWRISGVFQLIDPISLLMVSQ